MTRYPYRMKPTTRRRKPARPMSTGQRVPRRTHPKEAKLFKSSIKLKWRRSQKIKMMTKRK